MNSPEIMKHVLNVGSAKLIVATINTYLRNPIYTDKGTGATMDVSIWRPSPNYPNQFIIGDHAQPNHGKASTDPVQVVQVEVDDPAAPLLAMPVGYYQVWNDKGTGGDQDGSIWMPVAPAGYIAIGGVAQDGYSQPNISNYRCVRQDLVATSASGDLIWNDKKSGGDYDVSLYSIKGATGLFYPSEGYAPPSGIIYCVNR